MDDCEIITSMIRAIRGRVASISAAIFTFFVQRAKWSWVESATLITALLTLGATIYFGLYPRQPVEAALDPDTVYRGGNALGRVVVFNVEPVLAGQFVFRIVAVKPINKGDVLQFRTATCFVVDAGQVSTMASGGQNALLFNGTLCRVIGK